MAAFFFGKKFTATFVQNEIYAACGEFSFCDADCIGTIAYLVNPFDGFTCLVVFQQGFRIKQVRVGEAEINNILITSILVTICQQWCHVIPFAGSGPVILLDGCLIIIQHSGGYSGVYHHLTVVKEFRNLAVGTLLVNSPYHCIIGYTVVLSSLIFIVVETESTS